MLYTRGIAEVWVKSGYQCFWIYILAKNPSRRILPTGIAVQQQVSSCPSSPRRIWG